MSGNPYEVKYYNRVKCSKIEWLWYPYIPYGKITLLQGDPGEGKSTVAIALAALVSNGASMPFSKASIPASTVVYQNNEDGKEDTICPRLKASGANLERIAYIDETETGFAIGDERIDQVLADTGARLLILDPIQAYFGGGTDMNRASDVRPILNRLAQIAQRRKCAVVLIGHMSKATGMKGLYRSLGSIDIAAAARSVLLVSRMHGPRDERIIAQIKNNLAPIGDSIVFSINRDSTVEWLRKSKLTADQIIAEDYDEPKTKLERAVELITELVGNGVQSAREIKSECIAQGISARTIDEAKARLGIKSEKRHDGWVWVLGASVAEGSGEQ